MIMTQRMTIADNFSKQRKRHKRLNSSTTEVENELNMPVKLKTTLRIHAMIGVDGNGKATPGGDVDTMENGTMMTGVPNHQINGMRIGLMLLRTDAVLNLEKQFRA